MSRLLGIELHNFKSYKGTASVGFGTANFTSIIGPNGSGKSNMMDAISFVLGVRSSHLRSNQLRDLIYRGRIMDSEDLSDSGEEHAQDQDPEMAYVMAIYQKEDGTKINLKRTITKSGNSEYKINNKTVSATEYSNLLKEENILIKARNFLVFQGDVEQIASQSPIDLANLIETVSGSIELKKDYNKAKDEQDKAKELTSSLLSKKRTLASELKQYDEQNKEAELFKEQLKEKNDLIVLFNLFKLFKLEEKYQEKSNLIISLKNELKALQKTVNSKESEFNKAKSMFIKESLKSNNYEKLISKTKKELNEKNRELLPIIPQQELLEKKISNFIKRIKDLNSDIERETSNVKTIENQIKVVSKTKQIAENDINLKNSKLNFTTNDQKEYETLKEAFLSNGGALEMETLNLLKNNKLEIESVLLNLKNQNDSSNEKINNLKSNLTSLKNELVLKSAELNELNETFNNKKKKLKEINLNNENYLNKEFELNLKLKETLIVLDELSATQRESNRERKLRENVATLKRLFPGVKGLVYDLCKPKQKKYEVAVSTILGKNFDSIIVENSSVAKQCIDYLKEQRSGVASFIPLDSIEVKSVDPRLRQLDSDSDSHHSRPTIDIIDYDPSLERAMQYVCGDSMICDTIEIAKNLRWNKKINVKVCTIDGSLIHKAGLMTGGSSSANERRWDKSEFNTLTKLKDDLIIKIDEIENSKIDPLEIKFLENVLTDLESQIGLSRRRRGEIERLIADNEAEIKYYLDSNEILKKIDLNEAKLNEINQKIDIQNTKIEKLQESIFKDFCLKFNFNSIKEYESSTGNILREQTRELKQYDTELLKLNNKLQFEQERLTETTERVQKTKIEKTKTEAKLNELKAEKETINDNIDHIKSELELIEIEFKEFEKGLEDRNIAIKSIEEDFNNLIESYNSKKKSFEMLQQTIEELILEKMNILKTCKIESISIPLVNFANLDDLPIDNNSEEEQEKVIDFCKKIEVDFKKLNDDDQYKYTEEHEFTNKIEELTLKLESLSPNIKAYERLIEVSKKMKEFERELNKSRNNELNLVKRFQEIKQQRYKLFINSFNHISSKIDSIYKELTKSNNNELSGGSADLTLEDEDEPYLFGIKYHAMPPMKKFSDMELLSGGEKTIAALALLFAIHSFNPSPFFVLDEVDAALDNTNVSRIARYINKHAKPGFQFIVISLKNGLFEKSDALVGIYREEENSSKTLTLDLREFSSEVAAA